MSEYFDFDRDGFHISSRWGNDGQTFSALDGPGHREGYDPFLARPAQAGEGRHVKLVYQLNENTKVKVDELSPDTLLVYRRQDEIWKRLPANLYQVPARDSCDEWMLGRSYQNHNLMYWWSVNVANYHDPWNEPVAQTPEEATWLNAWTLRAQEIASEYNFKLALYSSQ
jgi:hypothetical protein